MVEDKYIGLALAVLGTIAIGASFVITKKGLNEAADRHGFEGDGFSYFKSPVWWAGIVTMVLGEIGNFAAYAFAPAILVTPLGALSVLIGSVLGAYFLNERLGVLGKIGCSTCLIGAVIIVLHAPPDPDIESIETLLNYALQPGFLIYSLIVTIFSVVMIYRVAPKYGKKNPLVYLSICSATGSVSIMAIKAFGIALKLTFGGNNQFTHASTYVFGIIVVVCIMTQMNYFNKALATFSTNLVNPIYYVTFTTATLTASFILFQGFNTSDPVNTISLLCGFLVIFSGVYLLNLSREDPDGIHLHGSGDRGAYQLGGFEDAAPTDGIGILGTRRSMQARRSNEYLSGIRSGHHSRRVSAGSNGSIDGLMRGYAANNSAAGGGSNGSDRDPESAGGLGAQSPRHHQHQGFGLEELAEDSDEEDEGGANGKKISYEDELGQRHSSHGNGTPISRLSGSGQQRVKREQLRMGGPSGKGGGGRDA